MEPSIVFCYLYLIVGLVNVTNYWVYCSQELLPTLGRLIPCMISGTTYVILIKIVGLTGNSESNFFVNRK